VYEEDTSSAPVVRNCLFQANPDGDYHDCDTSVTLTGAAAINDLGGNSGNVEGDPMFVMNGPAGICGAWTTPPVYSNMTVHTTLTDAGAGFTPGAMVGRLLNADTSQRQQALIVANTATTIEVVGNATGGIAAGDAYKVIDYHLRDGSQALDRGLVTGAPTVDFEGDPRPGGDGLVDIGADEAPDGYDSAPWFSNILVTPFTVSAGQTVTLTFTASEALTGNPTVTVNSHAATYFSSSGHDYIYTMQVTNAVGIAPIQIQGTDATGHLGVNTTVSALCVSGAIYVNATIAIGGTGASWAEAKRTIDEALRQAGNGNEIWVAAGVYYPTHSSAGNPNPADPRAKTFALKMGVAVYGGFTGTETVRAQRNWATHATVLCGDIGTLDDSSDNSYWVVVGATGATLDGFTVTGGHENGKDGAGMYNGNCSPIVTNCMFARNPWGGMYNENDSSPVVTNCVFAGSSGPGMDNEDDSSPVVTNCVFAGNSGPGMDNDSYSSPVVTNCTFTGNESGGMVNGYQSSPVVTNCILWGDGAPEIAGEGTSLRYSCIDQDGYAGSDGNIRQAPRFVRSPSPGPDALWGTSDDDYGDLRALPGSPCIDAGLGDGGVTVPVTDMVGNPRLDDPGVLDTGAGSPTYVDMGAYEGVRSPPWYPRFSWPGQALPGGGVAVWHNVQIWRDGEPDAAGAELAVDTNVAGTVMTPEAYFKAGSEGLLPGTYSWRCRGWDPVSDAYSATWYPATARGGAERVVDDYGPAAMPRDLAVTDNGAGNYTLEFTCDNARGYELTMTGPNGYSRTFRHVFAPDAAGVIPLNRPSALDINLVTAGTYSWEVRGFNPVDEAAGTETWSDPVQIVLAAQGTAVDMAQQQPGGLQPPDGWLCRAPGEILLQWDPVPGAAGYLLYLGSSDGHLPYNYADLGAVTSLRVNVQVGSYFWTVIAYDAGYVGSRPGAMTRFDVIRNAGAPVIQYVAVDADPTTLTVGVAGGTSLPQTVDIRHYDADSAQWRTFLAQPVAGATATEGTTVTIAGADFTVGEYVMISGTSATGLVSPNKVLVIE